METRLLFLMMSSFDMLQQIRKLPKGHGKYLHASPLPCKQQLQEPLTEMLQRYALSLEKPFFLGIKDGAPSLAMNWPQISKHGANVKSFCNF
ncbi:MAG: hypothetical protein ABS37_03260 [Acidovorax sp. SCN 65-108]|nr:MAG: hypothetical protein ABS37_03260 [Acidovorax sp. SCN 65-108]OJV70912.1 MAG: hypothetical protein BGO35_20175 [Burkholderiales bacterium 64-34]